MASGDGGPGADAAIPLAGGRMHGPVAPGDALALLLLCLWSVLFFVRIHYGCDFLDEGMYLSAIDRIARGDLPFRDEQENPLRQFDLLIGCLGRPFGGFSLIGIRCVGIAVQLAQMVAVWALVRRWQGPVIAALSVGLIPCVPLYGAWTPGYNEIACTLSVIFGCCLALTGGGQSGGGQSGGALTAGGQPSANPARTALAWGAVAGVAFGLDCLCYLPAAALGGVPALMIAVGRWRGGTWRHAWVLGGVAALVTAAVVVGIDAAVIGLAGLGPDWLAAARENISQQNLCIPLRHRLATALQDLADVPSRLIPTIAFLAALRWLLPRPGRPRAGWILVPGFALALALNLTFVPAAFATRTQYTFYGATHWMVALEWSELDLGLACAVVFIVPAALRAAWRGRGDLSAGAGLAMLVFLLFAGISGIASTILVLNGLNIRASVLALGAAGLAGFLRDAVSARRASPPASALASAMPPSTAVAFAALACQLVLAAMLAVAGWQLVKRETYPANCTATYLHPPMTGVHSTPDLVRSMEALRQWLDANQPADARMIAYDDVPLLYFALHRLPVLDWTWTTASWSWLGASAGDGFSARLLERMQARGRQAGFCVRHIGTDDPGKAQRPQCYSLGNPLHAYVQANYRTVWRFWPYEVLVLRDAATPWTEPRMIVDALQPTQADPSARLFLAPGTAIEHRADGAIVLSTAASTTDTVLLGILRHDDADRDASLRLRVDSDDPDLYAMIAIDQVVKPIGVMNERIRGGWDGTFPAGMGHDRGFVLVLKGTDADPAVTRHCVIQGLSLAEFPPLAMPSAAAGSGSVPTAR